MKSFQAAGMRYDGAHFLVLDQTLLPQREEWLICDDVPSLITIIKRLAIRGAPAIGISASILLGLLAERGRSRTQLLQDAAELRSARPTAVNLMNNIDRIIEKINADDYKHSVPAEALRIFDEDVEQCERIAHLGMDLLGDGARILTHCNTGGLATAGIGTAFGVIAKAHEHNKDVFVWVSETRPLLQGGRLTTWECNRHGIPHRLICDSAAAILMRQGEVDTVLVGADRIAVNGDFANKIGTYSLAVLAGYHGVPFYVVAPHTTVDASCPDGFAIPIEERDGDEVRGVCRESSTIRWSPEASEVYNPAFDVTPAELVSGWVLDTGVFSAVHLQKNTWWKG